MRGYAYYSPLVDAPPGGLCLSAFALLRRGDAYLVGRPRAHARWAEWAPNWDVYEPAQVEAQYQLWRLPAAYLREGEGPGQALERIVRGQLGAASYQAGEPKVLSFHDPSGRFPGQKHWDLCFVHDVQAEPAALGQMPWWAELRWARPGELRGADFGSAIGDLVEALGWARPGG